MSVQRSSNPLWLSGGLCCVLISGIVMAAIGASTFQLTVSDLITSLFSQTQTLASQLIYTIRLPRILVAAAAGASLALAGALMQGITRNPLASPALFGINAGAACLLVMAQTGIVAVLADWPLLLVTAMGAAGAGAIVMLLGGGLQGRIHPVRVVLAGIAVTALLTALTRTLLILDEQAQAVLDWLSGSLLDTDWSHWQQLWPWLLGGFVASLALAQSLNLLALGEEMAAGLGISPLALRIKASIVVIVLAAATVAVTGPIAFVGLLVPHLARKLVGHDHRVLLPVVALLGACLMVWADLLSRLLAFPAETPVGLVTALIGAPCFLWLTSRRREVA